SADLYSLQAMEDEQALDFAAAETHWKKYAEAARDKSVGYSALADFYGRRVQPQAQIAALDEVAKLPANGQERLLSSAEQGSWHAFEHVFEVIQSQALPPTTARQQYRLWISRYPTEQYVYAQYFSFLLDQREFVDALQ